LSRPPAKPPKGKTPKAKAGTPEQAAAPARKRGWFKAHTPLYWIVEGALVFLLTVGVLLLGLRIAPLTQEMRLFIQTRAEGLQIGPYGRLHLEGLGGDIWRDFTVRRLTITDAKGVWLQADDLRIRWRYAELLRSRLHVTDVDAARLQLLRQPVARKDNRPPSKPPAFSYAVDHLKTRVEMTPAFAIQKGVYDLAAGFAMEDRGATTVHLDAKSVLRPGDFLTVALELGKGQALKLDADAKEVKGGALAGALGLDPAQPFDLTAHITGTVTNGKLQAVVRSGAAVPLQAQGAWSPKGGGVSGHVVLGASRWTRYLTGPFGPEAEVALIGKQRSGSLYDMDVRLIAANVVLMGKGPLDLAKRSSPGMNLAVVVNDLHKVTSFPQMGAGKASGVIAGDLGDLHFSGDAEAKALELWGWRLQRAAGPVKVSWKKGELDVQGQVAGFGGSGAGVIAEAGGVAPKASVEVVRLKDGRVLIKSLDATGKGVRLQGTGGQNPLFQGLSFKGDLQITDLGQVLPGAGGGLNASWSAGQDAGFDKPWVFTAEGRGQRMTTGTAEIDRLMGPEPRLTLQANFVDGAFNIGKAALEGAKEKASAEGRWALAGDIDVKLDWEAEGPFGFGPLEIDGKAAGAGRITGMIAAPKIELAANFGSIAFPKMTVRQAHMDLTLEQGKDGSDGAIALLGQSDYGAARARANFRFLPTGIDLTAIDADAGGIKAKGGLSLRDGSPSSADLNVDIGPGALLSQGEAKGVVRIGGDAKAARADVDLTAKGVVLRDQPLALATARVTASGPLAQLPYKITADGAWLHTPVKVDGSGVLAKDPKGYAITFSGSGNLRRAPFRTLEPVTVRLDEDDKSARLRLALGGGQAQLDGRQAGGAMTLKADLTGVDLSFLSEDFTGDLDAHVALQGQGPELHGSFDAALKDAKSRDARKGLSIDGQFKGVLQGGRITLDGKLGSQQGLTATANLSLPAEASAAPFRIALVKTKPMQGAFEANGEIQPLWDLFLGGERTVGGKLTAKADITGTIADPKVTGRADLMDGLFDDYASGLKLRAVNLGAALNTDSITIDRLQATDGAKGRVDGSGRMNLARDGGGNLTLNLTGFRLVDNDTAQADASGPVTLTREADGKAKLTGALEIQRAEVNAAARTGPNIVTMDVIEKNKPFSLDEQLAPPVTAAQPQGVVALDVTLKAKRGILIKGRGLDADMSLDARVTGTTLKPVFDGDARVVRGDYDFAGKRFEFDNRGVVHLSNDPNFIRLDLTATRQDPSLTAVIRIQGTAAKPQITLTSSPVLPNDEVLSQVLFGSSAAQLSPLEAAQLASALSALAGGGGFDVVGNLRAFARLDRLALVGGTAATGVSVAGGKYLTDNVYVELAGGGRAGPSVQVEYRVTHNFSVVSKLANQTTTQGGGVPVGGASLSVRWRHDFNK
jgi:translocation and assembly module TamB